MFPTCAKSEAAARFVVFEARFDLSVLLAADAALHSVFRARAITLLTFLYFVSITTKRSYVRSRTELCLCPLLATRQKDGDNGNPRQKAGQTWGYYLKDPDRRMGLRRAIEGKAGSRYGQ